MEHRNFNRIKTRIMKLTALLFSILFIYACGSSETTSPEDKIIEDSATAVIPATDTIQKMIGLPEIQEGQVELKEKNQVNDYAEYFLQAKVFDDHTKMNYEQGDMHYYEVLDIKNGYAKVTGAYEGSYTFAIWRMANGNDLVGKTSMSCGPVCDYTYEFFEITPDGDLNVTKTVLPQKEISEHCKFMVDKAMAEEKMDQSVKSQMLFELPQQGTDIQVYLSLNSNELEFPLLTLSWDKSKFTISKKFDVIP